jgi:sugar-specific transcriptional regulator TrmB
MERYLQKLGLEEKEIQVYLACLGNVQNSPAGLVKQTGLKRSTVYFYLDKLSAKGLIEQKIKHKRKHYQVVNPTTAFEVFFDQKEGELTEQKRTFEKLLPKLIQKSKEKIPGTKITFLEGKAGVHNLIKKMLNEKKDLYWYGSIEAAVSLIGEENLYKRLTLERMKQSTTSYAITDEEILKIPKQSEKIGNFRKFRFLEKKLNLQAMLIIFGDYVCITSQVNHDIKVVLIEDNLMAEILLSMFWNLWERMPAERDE